MIATSALLATVRPNVGPTDVLSNERTPKRSFSALCTFVTLPGCNCLAEIWKTLVPSALLETFWTSGLLAPAALTTELTCDALAGAFRLAVIRVPEVKSIPRFRPRPPTASAPISRITPDIEKKYLDAPMKSNPQVRFLPPAPSAEGREMVRESPIVIRIAWVASTAVNRDTITPIPSVNAKPLTSEVARDRKSTRLNSS